MYKERVVSEGKCSGCLSAKELLNILYLFYFLLTSKNSRARQGTFKMQRFLVWVRLVAMCRGELFTVIAQLMSKLVKWVEVVESI